MVRVGLHQPGLAPGPVTSTQKPARSTQGGALLETQPAADTPPPPWVDFKPTKSTRVHNDPPVLGHMGAALERLAAEGDPLAHRFSVPLSRTNRSHTRAAKSKRQPSPEDVRFSFSGLKTAVLRATEAGDMTRRAEAADIAASFQRVAGTHLTQQLQKAIVQIVQDPGAHGLSSDCFPRHVVVSGGAAANMHLRDQLSEASARAGLQAVFPPLSLCSDNGAMVAYAAALKLDAGFSPLTPCQVQAQVDLSPRWELGTQQSQTLPTAKRIWGEHSVEVQAVLADPRFAFLLQ